MQSQKLSHSVKNKTLTILYTSVSSRQTILCNRCVYFWRQNKCGSTFYDDSLWPGFNLLTFHCGKGVGVLTMIDDSYRALPLAFLSEFLPYRLAPTRLNGRQCALKIPKTNWLIIIPSSRFIRIDWQFDILVKSSMKIAKTLFTVEHASYVLLQSRNLCS